MYQKNEDEYTDVYVDEKEEPKAQYKHTISSKIAFMLGVPEKYFDEEQIFDREIFDQMHEEKRARIIRNLCILRTAIMKNANVINKEITYNMHNLSQLPELIPQDSLKELSEDGVIVEKANCRLITYTTTINELIKSRVSECRDLFPEWINWDYVKDLYIMPNGTKESKVTSETSKYGANYGNLPFNMYINWAGDDAGKILIHDLRFVTRLYEVNHDTFKDTSKVRDASDVTKKSIYDFLNESTRTSILVDCENSDPYRLYAVLKGLDQKELLPKITKIILFDDFHTTDAWKILEDFTDIPVEYRQIDRVKMNKSLVDQTLMITATKMTCFNNIDSFVLAASDSDYWALIRELPYTKFLVMVEKEKCGPDILKAMDEEEIPYCFMNDFCTADISDIKTRILMKEIRTFLDSSLAIDLNQMVVNATSKANLKLTPDEVTAQVKSFSKKIRLAVDDKNIMRLELS